MGPKKQEKSGHGDLFRSRLDQFINLDHELVRLADEIDWSWVEAKIASVYPSTTGRPAVPTRFIIGLFLLKEVYNLSDESLCARWTENPYFQYFTGEEFYQHSFPHDRSVLSHWRKRVGEGLEVVLRETLRVAFDLGALKASNVEAVTVDTTVMEKAVGHPNDAKLLYTALSKLGALSVEHKVPLRQSYKRVGKKAMIMAGRYAHAKQFKRMKGQLRFLSNRLSRLIKDIRRKIDGDERLEAIFAEPLFKAHTIRKEQKSKKGRTIFSWHAGEVECIGKGKARKPYEFGVKVSVSTTNARSPGGQFVLEATALPGKPYDGHTLAGAIERIQANTGVEPKRIFVDKGYTGHGLTGKAEFRVYRAGLKRVTQAIKKQIKRRSAIEPVIGHMKSDGRMDRNFLKGKLGDKIQAIMAAVGHNCRLILKWIALCALILITVIQLQNNPTYRQKATWLLLN